MDEATDLSRRIDDLLSGAIDEQVREQRAMAEIIRGLTGGIAGIGEQVSALTESVEAAREAAERAQLAPGGGPLGGLADRFESIETAIGELSATVSALADRPEPATLDPEEARALFGAMREVTTSESGELRGALDAQMERLREETITEFTGLRDAVLTEIVTGRESALAELVTSRDALFAEIVTSRDALFAEIAGARGMIADDLEGVRVTVRETVEVVRASLATALDTARDTAEARHGETTQAFADSRRRIESLEERVRKIDAAVDAVAKAPEELRIGLSELGSTVVEQTDTLLEESRSTNEAAAARMGVSAQRLAEDSGHVSTGLTEIAERFETLQESLLAYLQVRDVALEEERDLVISELLDEFAQSLDTKQRQLFGRGIRAAWATRRERRAGRRMRLAGETPVPRMPQVPPDVLRAAGEALAKPAPAERRPPAVTPPSPAQSRGGPVPVPVAPASTAKPSRPAKASARPEKAGPPAKKAAPAPKKPSPTRIKAAQGPLTPATPGAAAPTERPEQALPSTAEEIAVALDAHKEPEPETTSIPGPAGPQPQRKEEPKPAGEEPKATARPRPRPAPRRAPVVGDGDEREELAAAARSELSEIASALERGEADEVPGAPSREAGVPKPIFTRRVGPSSPPKPGPTPSGAAGGKTGHLPGQTQEESEEARAAKLARAARRRARSAGQPFGKEPVEPSREPLGFDRFSDVEDDTDTQE